MCMQTGPAGLLHEVAAMYDMSTTGFEQFHISESPFCSGTNSMKGFQNIQVVEKTCTAANLLSVIGRASLKDHS